VCGNSAVALRFVPTKLERPSTSRFPWRGRRAPCHRTRLV
jgi:hypothetical protein